MDNGYFSTVAGRIVPAEFKARRDERISQYRNGWLLQLPGQDAIYFATLSKAERALVEHDAATLVQS
jgi:hypothetical protein